MQQDPTIIDDYLADDKQPEKLSDIEIFTRVWLQPKRVFNYVKYYQYKKFITPIYLITGMMFFISRSENAWKSTHSLFLIISIILVSSFIMLLFYYLYAFIIKFTGRWIGGKGDTKSLYRLIGFARIPNMIVFPMIVAQIAVYRESYFRNDFSYDNNIEMVLNYIPYYLSIFLGLWSFGLIIIAISVAHNFSIGKAILNWLISLIFVLAIPIAMVLYKLY